MARYHVRADGSMGVCTARSGQCPFGSEEGTRHFTSEARARAYSEERVKEMNPVTPRLKRYHRTFMDMSTLPQYRNGQSVKTVGDLRSSINSNYSDRYLTVRDPHTGVALTISDIRKQDDGSVVLVPYVDTDGNGVLPNRFNTVAALKHELGTCGDDAMVSVLDWETGEPTRISHVAYDYESGGIRIDYGHMEYPFSKYVETHTVYRGTDADGFDSPAYQDMVQRIRAMKPGEYAYVYNEDDDGMMEVGSSSFYSDRAFDMMNVQLRDTVPTVMLQSGLIGKNPDDVTASDVITYQYRKDGTVVSSNEGVRCFNSQVPESMVILRSHDDADQQRQEAEAALRALVPDAGPYTDVRIWKVSDVRDTNGNRIDGVSVYCSGTNMPAWSTLDDSSYAPFSPWEPMMDDDQLG